MSDKAQKIKKLKSEIEALKETVKKARDAKNDTTC